MRVHRILLQKKMINHTSQTVQQKPRAVIGLALGGGASKGFAHIGVLKVLRENNIPVRVVTGTSAGGIEWAVLVCFLV